MPGQPVDVPCTEVSCRNPQENQRLWSTYPWSFFIYHECFLFSYLQHNVHVRLLDGLEWEVGLAEEDALAHDATVLHAQVHEAVGEVDEVGGQEHVEGLVESGI